MRKQLGASLHSSKQLASTTVFTMPVSPTQPKHLFGLRRFMLIMLACVITWNIATMSQLFAPPQNHSLLLRGTETYELAMEPPREQTKKPVRTVHFLENNQLHINDHFSATWIQPLSNFMQVNVSNIKTVEDGCFQVFRQDRNAVKMTLDWLDFSVEHLSKWWKVADIFDKDAVPFNRAMTALQAYTSKTILDTHQTSPLRHTIAMIAFQPFVDPKRDDSIRARPLTVHSLAATIASLANVGMGRVVVTGIYDTDKEIVQETFRYLQRQWTGVDENVTVTTIGPLELGFVKVHKEETKTSSVELNIPKAALQVLQQAFQGDLDDERTKQIFGTTTEKSYWKYVYLTEPDTILQTKPYALSQLKQALDEGFVLAPHRLQPIPHEADFVGMKDTRRFVPAEGNFSNVLDLNTKHENAVCCDEQAGSYKPWKDYFDKCGTFWWDCGFSPNTNYSHVHLSPGMR